MLTDAANIWHNPTYLLYLPCTTPVLPAGCRVGRSLVQSSEPWCTSCSCSMTNKYAMMYITHTHSSVTTQGNVLYSSLTSQCLTHSRHFLPAPQNSVLSASRGLPLTLCLTFSILLTLCGLQISLTYLLVKNIVFSNANLITPTLCYLATTCIHYTSVPIKLQQQMCHEWHY